MFIVQATGYDEPMIFAFAAGHSLNILIHRNQCHLDQRLLEQELSREIVTGRHLITPKYKTGMRINKIYKNLNVITRKV
jgi:hypothetical protein